MPENIFQIFASCLQVPFAAGRNGGEGRGYFTVILKVEPKDNYGNAFSFAVEGAIPSEHFSYNAKWVRFGEIPCAGCYQWTHVPKSQEEIEVLIRRFESTIRSKYSWPIFGLTSVEVQRDDPLKVKQEKRIYLNVPYSEKDQAKLLGARWDTNKRKWYILNSGITTAFSRWL